VWTAHYSPSAECSKSKERRWQQKRELNRASQTLESDLLVKASRGRYTRCHVENDDAQCIAPGMCNFLRFCTVQPIQAPCKICQKRHQVHQVSGLRNFSKERLQAGPRLEEDCEAQQESMPSALVCDIPLSYYLVAVVVRKLTALPSFDLFA